MRDKAYFIMLLIIGCIAFGSWKADETTTQKNSTTRDYTKSNTTESCIHLKVNMTKTEIMEIDSLYPYLKETITPINPSDFMGTGNGYEILLQDNTTFILALDRDEQLYMIYTVTPGFHLNTGIGIGSTFKEVKQVYPTYTIERGLYSWGVMAGNEISFWFHHLKSFENHDSLDMKKVLRIEFQEIFIPHDMIDHEAGPIAKGLHARRERTHKAGQIVSEIYQKMLRCRKDNDCQAIEVKKAAKNAFVEIEDLELLAEVAILAWGSYSAVSEDFKKEYYQIYRLCIERLVEFPGQKSDKALKYIQEHIEFDEGERAFLEKLIQRLEE